MTAFEPLPADTPSLPLPSKRRCSRHRRRCSRCLLAVDPVAATEGVDEVVAVGPVDEREPWVAEDVGAIAAAGAHARQADDRLDPHRRGRAREVSVTGVDGVKVVGPRRERAGDGAGCARWR